MERWIALSGRVWAAAIPLFILISGFAGYEVTAGMLDSLGAVLLLALAEGFALYQVFRPAPVQVLTVVPSVSVLEAPRKHAKRALAPQTQWQKIRVW